MKKQFLTDENMRKAKIAGCVIAVVIGIIGVIGFIFDSIMPDEFEAMKTNWGLEVPGAVSLTEIYEKAVESSFHGDGVRYHVYSYEKEAEIESMLAWEGEERSTCFYESYSEAVDVWLKEIEVPEEKYPDYEKCMYWYKQDEADKRNEIIVLWNQEERLVYFVESFF